MKKEKSLGDSLISGTKFVGGVLADVWISSALIAICPPAGALSWIGMHIVGGVIVEQAGNYCGRWAKAGVDLYREIKKLEKENEKKDNSEAEAD